MIPFIRKSLENGSLVAEDHITTEWDLYKEGRRNIVHEHRIILKDTRTGESVLVGFFKEGEKE